MKYINNIICKMKLAFFILLLLFTACKHKEIKKETSNLYPVVFENNKCGYINDNGDTIIKPTYDYAGFFEYEMSIICIKEKYGIINKQNKIIVKPIYDYLGVFTKNILVGMINHQTYLIDLKKDTIYHYNYETAGLWNNKTFVMIDSNNHIMLLNLENMKIIPTEYTDIILPLKSFYYGQSYFSNIKLRFSNREISNEYGIIVSKNKVGYIKYTGEIISEPKYDYAYFFQNNRGIVKLNNKWGIIDNLGNIITKPQYDAIFRELLEYDKKEDIGHKIKHDNFILELGIPDLIFFHEGITCVKRKNKWGFIDTSGKVIVKPIYDWVSFFSSCYAIVKQHNKFGCIDKSGKIVIQIKYKEFRPFYYDLSIFKENNKYGFMNIKGEKVLGFYDFAEEFNDIYSIVKINDKYGIIDTTGKYIIQPKYDKIVTQYKELYEKTNYHYNTILNNKMGYLNRNCDVMIVADKYDYIGNLKNGIIVVTKNKKDGFVDSLGKEIVSPKYERINDFERDITFIEENNQLYYINKGGKIIFGPIKSIAYYLYLDMYLNHSYLLDYPK